jgi:hypothetical protein
MNKEKLPIENLEDLAKFSLSYAPFREEIGQKGKLTVRQFAYELALEMDYQRELDLEQGIDNRKKENREGI